MLSAIEHLSSYISVQKKSTFRGFLLQIFPKFERTGQKAPRVSIKGKPRDLDYPACWTGARRCGAEIGRAALSANPPKCKNSGTAGFELPQMCLLHSMRISLTIRPSI